MSYEEYLASRRQMFKKILDACNWFSLEDLQERMPHVGAGMRVLLNAWEDGQRIFSIQGKKGRLYPPFQFDQNFQPLPIIQEILKVLQQVDELDVAGWFVFRNELVTRVVDGQLVTVAPMSALADRQAILLAAKNGPVGKPRLIA